MLNSVREDGLVSFGTWPHWHPLKRILSCLFLGDPLTEPVSTGLSSHLPTHCAFMPGALQGRLSMTQCLPPAACWLALSGNFCILLRAFGKYSCSPMSLADHRKLSKRAFSPPWPKHFVFLSWSHAMLAAVAKLLPPWILEEKAQDQSHSPLQLALCHPVSPSFQPWTST